MHALAQKLGTHATWPGVMKTISRFSNCPRVLGYRSAQLSPWCMAKLSSQTETFPEFLDSTTNLSHNEKSSIEKSDRKQLYLSE